jgi:hypothetical protein
MRPWIGLFGAMLLLAMGGCPADGTTVCGEAPATAACGDDQTTRGACLAEGGCWGVWGLAPGPSCNCPTTDADEPCTAGADCQGHCLATAEEGVCPDEGACSDMERVFGCYCFLEGGMGDDEMCVD